ncbi:hypothetical protein NliqN6_0553 [Naganishia liquefaciens]|uniref:Uncharacterized protein n=1 Tax=Naganishia liquefaciens TaxID=104408 RepID=A0A8H3TN21_9TREE|nr:hypothetical protein NliqN6_0553 [Naganishia liquefaciens]
MQGSRIAQGASRLPLTSKRGNKDFYKGTRQAFVPGGGHRTGPPGKHVIGGKAKYRVLDEKVRYFVSPGADVLNISALKPYVATTNPPAQKEKYRATNPYIPFGPNATHVALETTDPRTGRPLRIAPHDTKAFSKWYQALSIGERAKVVAEQRRDWYVQLAEQQRLAEEEEAKTRQVESS